VRKIFLSKKGKTIPRIQEKRQPLSPCSTEQLLHLRLVWVFPHSKCSIRYDKRQPDGMGRLSAYHQKKRKPTEF
jgi:hypothetical protein